MTAAAAQRSKPIDIGVAIKRWRRQPTTFIEEMLHDPETGKPFKLLDAERAFLELALTTDPDGRLRYPDLIYGAIKKSGKTGFAALFAITVLLLYGGRYAEGYCVANDLEQAQSRVYEAIRRIVEVSPLLRREAKVTQDRITFLATGATVTCLASDYASAAGSHPVVAVFDELWGYSSERSRRLWDEMVPVPTRKISCRLTVTHAGFEGEGQLLQELYNRGLAQPQVGPSLYAGDGMLMAWHHEPIAPWQDERWLADMRRSLRPNQYLRMIENKFVTTESTFIDLACFDACVDAGAHPLLADRSLPVWLGVDASVKRDSTAIVACTWDHVANKVRLVAHRIFQPTRADPLDFEATVEQTISDMCRRFRVREVRYDPYQMQSSAQRLTKQRVPMVEFPQSPANLTEASQGLFEAVKSQGLVVYPDDELRLAVRRAVAVEMPRGWKISKEKASHKIDVVVALAMATLGAVQGGIARKPLRVTAAAVARARAMGRTPPIFFGGPRSFYGAYPPR